VTTQIYLLSSLHCPMLLRGVVFKRLMTCMYFTYRQFQHSQILCSAHTVDLCVLYGSQNKQRLFPYTTLTQPKRSVFTARYGLSIYNSGYSYQTEKRSDAWKPYIKPCSFGRRKALGKKVLSLSF
jgi:hypothetical protein